MLGDRQLPEEPLGRPRRDHLLLFEYPQLKTRAVILAATNQVSALKQTVSTRLQNVRHTPLRWVSITEPQYIPFCGVQLRPGRGRQGHAFATNLWMTFALCSPTITTMSRYAKANHRIFMQFLEPGLQTPLPKKLTFRDEGKIRELPRRGEAWQTSEDRQLLDYAIAKGEGGVYLRLSPEQYARLRRP
jgi:hypothetical protein